MPNTEFDIYNGTHSCVEIDNNIDEVIAARGTRSTLNSRLGDIESAIHDIEPTATEVTNARTDADGTVFESLKDRLDTEGQAVKTEIESIEKSFTSGLNLLNPDTVKSGYILTSSGTETTMTGGFYSDFMEVIPGESYKIDRAIGSNSYPSVCFYNSSKVFVSASDGTSTTITVPANCYYARKNGSLAYLDTSMFEPAFTAKRYAFNKSTSGKNSKKCSLWSVSKIYYYSGVLHANTAIYLVVPDDVLLELGTSVTVSGTGAFLFWNKADGTLTAANSDISSDNIYYVCMLKYREFDPEVKFTAISCAYPAFTFDLLTNKLYINFRYYGYIVYDGQTIEIPQNHTQEINIDNHCMIVYNVDSRQFEKIAYSAIQYDRGKYIPICVRNYNDIIGNFNYELVPYAKCYKKCYCYGDSLTWYDGHEFTWGDHQGEMCVGFESYLRAYLRMSVTNVGVSGETTPEICARLASDSGPRTANYITIMGGDNDDRLQITPGNVLPAGSTFDTTTVAGALQNAIETVQAANPDARIILMTEPIGWTYRNGDMERVDDEYPKTYRKVAEMYGLPLIDLWNESGINEMNREDYMIDPTVSDGNTSYIYHPSNKAWERIGKLICKVLEKY